MKMVDAAGAQLSIPIEPGHRFGALTYVDEPGFEGSLKGDGDEYPKRNGDEYPITQHAAGREQAECHPIDG